VELAMPPAPKVRPDIEPAAPEVKAKPVAPSAPVEAALDEDTQKFIAQSLTDVDLFASYGLTQKAIGLLEAILRRAPRHTPTLEKLLDFVLGAGDDRRTAELAAKLEQIYSERGDPRGAERFGELRRRFQRAAGLSDEELAGPVAQASAPAPVAEAEVEESFPEITSEEAITEFAIAGESVEIEEVNAAPVTASAEHEVAATSAAEEVHEVDLSDEWASMLEDSQSTEGAKPAPAPEPHVEAEAAPELELPAETPAPVTAEPTVEEFSISEEPAMEPAAAETAHAAVEIETPRVERSIPYEPAIEVPEEIPELPVAVEESAIQPVVEESVHHEATPEPPVVEPPPAVEHAAKVSEVAPKIEEPEFELDQDYELVLDPEPLVPAHDQKPPEIPIVPLEPQPEAVAHNAAPANGFASDQFLSDLAAEIDQLGGDQLSPEYSDAAPRAHASTPNKNAAKAEAASPVDVGPLKEVFDEFRAELGEMGADDEDLETHYNLGIAFREMGLLEEAISEFQKVAKASEKGRPFPYSMQCYTLLGLAFMDRGQPSIAAMWYERALHLPDIEPESELALRYDLGMAQESAGESDAALKSFSQVYAVNIDYRDVGERIAALQKPAR
jgi:tetratricopeptide (TPR) repeat protein